MATEDDGAHESESAAVSRIIQNTFALEHIAREFADALDLHLHCRSHTDPVRKNFKVPDLSPQGADESHEAFLERHERAYAVFDERRAKMQGVAIFDRWSVMAARLGAISIWEFQSVKGALSAALKSAPAYSAQRDFSFQKQAKKLFNSTFPNWYEVRTDAAHGRELTMTDTEFERHAADGSFMMSGCITTHESGCTYMATIKGRSAKYDLSRASADVLFEIAEMYKSALNPSRA